MSAARVSIEAQQQELIEEFSAFDDWMQKYEYIIELGKELPVIEEAYRNEDHLIKGCQSRVWLHAALDDEGNLKFTADSDAIITRGMVAMVIRVLDGQKPLDVANANLHFVNDIGLSTHLSPTRSNGLAAMIKQMKMYGLALSVS
jgi:cysteine desulfuration protein SufE